MNKEMTEIYGNKEDPWPYEYVINALQFFSMNHENRDKYIVNDFPEILFHGNVGDFITGNAQFSITEIFTEIISAGQAFDEWIEDENLEGIGIEDLFKQLHSLLRSMELNDLFKNWEMMRTIPITILNKLGWTETDHIPEYSCEKMLNEWSYGEYSAKLSKMKTSS